MYHAYVLYDAKTNGALSYGNFKRDEVQRLNKLIPKSNFSNPHLIWILLPAWHEVIGG